MNKLKSLREEHNLSSVELSEKTGVPYSTIRSYENGQRKGKTETWKVLADYFDVSVSYIMGLSDNKQDLTMSDLTDLMGEKMFDEDDGEFNTQSAEIESSKFIAKRIKPSQNLELFHIIKLIDPVTNDIRFSCLSAVFFVDFTKISIEKECLFFEIPVHFEIPSKVTSYNRVAEYKMDTKNNEMNDENFSPLLFSSFLFFKKMLDKKNGNTKTLDAVLANLINQAFRVLKDRRPDIFFEEEMEKKKNRKYLFTINYLNEEIKKITL